MLINEIYRQTIISLFSKMGITVIGFFATVYFAHTVGPSILGLVLHIPCILWNF